MTRQRQKSDGPTWDRLYETAAAQSGYLTLGQAVAAGYSPPLVHHYLKAGRLERVARGILRLVHFPTSEHEDLVVPWLWSERRGTFSHETALMLHGLSDALPAKAHLTVPASWRQRRLRVPRGLNLHFSDIPKADITWNGPVPLTSLFRTLVDMALEGNPELSQQAVTQALRRRLISQQDLRRGISARRLEEKAH